MCTVVIKRAYTHQNHGITDLFKKHLVPLDTSISGEPVLAIASLILFTLLYAESRLDIGLEVLGKLGAR